MGLVLLFEKQIGWCLLFAGDVTLDWLGMLIMKAVRVTQPITERINAAEELRRRFFETQCKFAVRSVWAVVRTYPAVVEP